MVVALLVLAATIVFGVCRRRRRRSPGPSVGELDDDPRGRLQTAELTGDKAFKRVAELAAGTMPAATELCCDRPAAELGGAAVMAPAERPRGSGGGGLSPAEDPGSPLPNVSQRARLAEQAVADLRARQARLGERRQRLLGLEQIDQERDALQHQPSVLQQHQQQSGKRYEMPE